MDESVVAIMFVPVILFMIFVAPIWLILHYRSKKQVSQGLSVDEIKTLKDMAIKAETMAERIETLETILDHEAPEWRKEA